jgi:hypothetical protein
MNETTYETIIPKSRNAVCTAASSKNRRGWIEDAAVVAWGWTWHCVRRCLDCVYERIAGRGPGVCGVVGHVWFSTWVRCKTSTRFFRRKDYLDPRSSCRRCRILPGLMYYEECITYWPAPPMYSIVHNLPQCKHFWETPPYLRTTAP